MRHEFRKDERRAYSRIELNDDGAPITVLADDGTSAEGDILDVSLGGARVRYCDALPDVGRTIWVKVAETMTRAEVCWRTATEFGLRFLTESMESAVEILESVLRGQLNDGTAQTS